MTLINVCKNSAKNKIEENEKGLDGSVDQHEATHCKIGLKYDTYEVFKPLESPRFN